MGQRVEVCFLWAGLEAVCHSNHGDRVRSSVGSPVSQAIYVQQETEEEMNLPSNYLDRMSEEVV